MRLPSVRVCRSLRVFQNLVKSFLLRWGTARHTGVCSVRPEPASSSDPCPVFRSLSSPNPSPVNILVLLRPLVCLGSPSLDLYPKLVKVFSDRRLRPARLTLTGFWAANRVCSEGLSLNPLQISDLFRTLSLSVLPPQPFVVCSYLLPPMPSSSQTIKLLS